MEGNWRSDCLRCEASLKRNVAGKWVAIALREFSIPNWQEPKSTVDPFSRPAPAKISLVDQAPQSAQTAFERNLIEEIVPQLGAANDRRDHYIGRAEEARLLAEMDSEQQVKVIHLEMAARYYRLANHHLEQPPKRFAGG